MTILTLAQRGQIKSIPKSEIKLEDLLAVDDNGVSTIIWAIANKELKEIPKELLTDKVLSKTDRLGHSGYQLAAKRNQFDYIPKHLITPKILKELGDNDEKTWGILIRGGQIRHVLPFIKELIDDHDLKDQCTLLHTCATTSEIEKIPEKHITLERLLKGKKDGNENVLHYAAHYGCLNQIPEELVTVETMNSLNGFNETPLHSAAVGGKLHLVPKKFLTQENLEKEDNWGTVFHKAAMTSNFKDFPKEFLTEKNLLRRSRKSGLNPIYILARECSEHTSKPKSKDAREQFKKLLPCLSEANLTEVIKELEDDNWLEAVTIARKELIKFKILSKINRRNEIEI
jgi:hypothetical protein